MRSAELYQFPISHYCEKARWALDHKRVTYRVKNLLPGPHVKQVTKIAPKTHVPVLKYDGKYIQGSDNIIDFLDQRFDDHRLTPANAELENDARQWERFAGKNIGNPIRCILYHELLEYPSLLIPALAYQGPWYGRMLLKGIYPIFKKTARRTMRIDAETAATSRQTLSDSVEKLNHHLSQRQYIVGDQFSRADLSVAALFSPLVAPPNSYFIWWDHVPESLKQFRDQFKNEHVVQWVQNIYQKHRTI